MKHFKLVDLVLSEHNATACYDATQKITILPQPLNTITLDT